MPMSVSATLIASPIPRVPPVTIATRAMNPSSCLKRTRLSRGSPTFKFAGDQLLQHGHSLGRIVEAVEPREMRAAGGEKTVAAADAELLEGFEAIGGESGGRDGEALHAFCRIFRER